VKLNVRSKELYNCTPVRLTFEALAH